MAHIRSFTIESFKGIDHVHLDLAHRTQCPVATLVGLNESGKTTILEALANFITREDTLAAEESAINRQRLLDYIPIAKKANFSGAITISAHVGIDSNDVERIKRRLAKLDYVLDTASFPQSVTTTRRMKFSEGSYKGHSVLWNLPFSAKKKRAKKFTTCNGPKQRFSKDENDIWIEATSVLKDRIPRVAYFPTFLVDTPDRIYLEERDDEQPAHRYYRDVLQDVLRNLDDNLDLQKHVVERINEYRENTENRSWLSQLFNGPDKGKIDAVMQKLSSAISREVLGSWAKVFKRPISAKLITIDWNVDFEHEGTPYVSINISDGESKYALHERSLGFRWFFLFLLFTSFKKDGETPTLFLFDEPAANLHARAQQELLQSFHRIIEHENKIVYSTHSPHMINPEWFAGTFIVENEAIDYDASDDFLSFTSPPTRIHATPYRKFISHYPERSSYFQPILERLDDVAPPIKPDGPILLTEGISDFHMFSYYCADLLESRGVTLIPGLGDTGHDPQIAMLLGTGQRFFVMLDDDTSGRKGADRYKDRWFLDASAIGTFGDLAEKAIGCNLEKLLSDETLGHIQTYFDIPSRPSKKQIGIFFAEANSGLSTDHSASTRDLARQIVMSALERIRPE